MIWRMDDEPSCPGMLNARNMGGGMFRLTMELGGGGGGHPLCVNNALPSQTIV